MQFKVIELNNPEWDEYVKSSYMYDFHHTSAYHKIEYSKGDEALLFVASSEINFIALPLIKRAIPDTIYFDATSVYGYAGPISSKALNEFPENIISFFKEYFLKYCNDHKIISIFSRLHPLIKQNLFFNSFGELKDLNKVVTIDLTEPVDVQRQHYSKSNKNQINQLKKKKGYSALILDSSDKEGILDFIDVYTETMDRVNANKFYYFDYEYFKSLLENKSFKSNLIAVYKDGKMCSAGIFTESNVIMQYHLSGTKNEFIKDNPMKLLLDEARLLANTKGLKYFNLGGGVGGSDDDSLFQFKASFSKNFYQFSVWNLVVNEDVYDRLNDEKKIKKEDYPNFFPLYRAKD